MDIKRQFNMIAKEYDANRRKFIPCFDDYYINTTAFVASNIAEPKCIVDLGAGTGLLSYFWYQHYPDAKYILVDIAGDMLGAARKRFDGIGNISYQTLNYICKLPDISYDTVISGLSIHHLENTEKRDLFTKIFNALPENGLFVNYDQFCAGDADLNSWYDAYWERQLLHSGLNHKDIELWRTRRQLDKECSVEEELDMLKKTGFRIVKCIYTYQKFSVIMAIK